MRLEIYDDSQKTRWDNFVDQSKNGTFLLQRDYMDYHRDRFEDHSLLIWDNNDKLIALLPAHKVNERFISHAGLTYGGFITDASMKTPLMLEIFKESLTYLQGHSFKNFIYKTIPHIYHRLPAEEDRYALYLCRAKVINRSVMTVAPCRHRAPFQQRRNRGVKKARKNKLTVQRCQDFEAYWSILTALIWQTYQTKPVHSLAEITRLHTRFPNNIKLYACFKADNMLAGVVIYETDRVARTQYIAANEPGKKMGALDLTFDYLLTDIYRQKPFFSFGTSNERNGFQLNKGLIDYKEGFGARAVVHDHYEIELIDWAPGQIDRAII